MIYNSSLSDANASALPLDEQKFHEAVAAMPPTGLVRELVLCNARHRVYRRADLLPREKLGFGAILDLWLDDTGLINQVDHEAFIAVGLGLQMGEQPRLLTWLLWRLAVKGEILWRPVLCRREVAPFVIPLLRTKDFMAQSHRDAEFGTGEAS